MHSPGHTALSFRQTGTTQGRTHVVVSLHGSLSPNLIRNKGLQDQHEQSKQRVPRFEGKHNDSLSRPLFLVTHSRCLAIILRASVQLEIVVFHFVLLDPNLPTMSKRTDLINKDIFGGDREGEDNVLCICGIVAVWHWLALHVRSP